MAEPTAAQPSQTPPQNRPENGDANHGPDGKFAKGNRANPGGRPKTKGLAKQLRAEIEHPDGGNDIIDFVLACRTGQMMKRNADINPKTGQVKRDKDGDPAFTYEMVDLTVEQRIALAKIILDRAYGTAPTHAPVEDADPLDLGGDIASVAAAVEREVDELAAKRREREAEAETG